MERTSLFVPKRFLVSGLAVNIESQLKLSGIFWKISDRILEKAPQLRRLFKNTFPLLPLLSVWPD